MAIRRGDDAGVTLLEVMVSMSVMAVVAAIFTAGIVGMYSTANGTEARATAQTQLSLALQRIDKQVRYASGVGREYSAGDDRYVEYLVAGVTDARCYRLRLSNGRLQQRTWASTAPPPVVWPWATLASGLSSIHPFRRVDADDAVGFQRLEVSLTAAAGAGSPAPATRLTFTALNTSRQTVGDPCVEGRNRA
jgi:prepilin-type N-terminal cleavage/methylation domain-containing protein